MSTTERSTLKNGSVTTQKVLATRKTPLAVIVLSMATKTLTSRRIAKVFDRDMTKDTEGMALGMSVAIHAVVQLTF